MRENRNVPFRDWNIRVSRNHNGQLHICAVDICDILKRDELLENGAIARVCPTALKISFRKNGREQWGFRPIDMRRLLQLVRKETIIPRDLLDELEVWGNKLLELEAVIFTIAGIRQFDITKNRSVESSWSTQTIDA